MTEHTAKIEWKKEGEFNHQVFGRTHNVEFYPGSQLKMAGGNNGEYADPEQMLAASLSSCHMQTFLALAAKKRLVVEHYSDMATAILEQNEEKLFYVSKIILRPDVQFSEDSGVDSAVIAKIHEKAHKHCFVANSIKCTIDIQPV